MNQKQLLNELTKRGIVYSQIGEEGVEYFVSEDYNIPLSLHYRDVAILQNKNICKSRLDVDVSSEVIRGVVLPIPLIASNMVSVVNAEMCIKLYELGALGIMHRAAPEKYIIKEMKKIANKCDLVAASVGVGEGQFEFAKKLVNVGVNILNVDIAHGYSLPVLELGRKIKKELGVKVIVGNTHNTDMFYEVNDFADALKVGLANGSVCSTKNTASCAEGQFTTTLKFKEISKKYGLPIISDGGITEAADFVKSIAGGASSVMAGSIFCRCPESAAEIIEINGKRKKIHYGMASARVQEFWRGGLKKGTCAEGKITYLDIGESVEKLLERYSGALRSGITYGGGSDIKSFQEKVRFTRL